nr:hypothetical protein [Tanacetum cinerariifolium]
IKVLPPKTAEEILARERERKAKTTLLMALLEDHLAKFHKTTDAKEMWEAIKSIFGGNNESKKMQKYLLKQQFKGFSVSNSKGLHKGYDRFQTLMSQLDIHGAGVSTKDANQKFLRSLPTSWSQVALIMITKPGIDTISFDDLYNNLRVFECDVKGTTASSSSNTQNVAFMFAKSTSSTNEVSTAYGVSSLFVSKSQKEESLSYTDEVIYSFFTNKSSAPQLHYDDLEQIDDDDIDEIDLKWQVAMISMRIKKFHKKTRRKLQFDAKEPVGSDKTKVECFNCHKIRHFARNYRSKGNQDSRRKDAGYNGNKARDNGRRPANQDDSKVLVTIDGNDIKWYGHTEEDTQNYVMMAYTSSNSGSDNESVFINKASDVDDRPMYDRKDRTSLKPKKMVLGYGFTRKACFVCGSFGHLIRDCDFHEKRKAKQVALTKSMNKVTCQRNDRPVWNNVQGLNHHNKFVPSAVLTNTGSLPVYTARQNFSTQVASTSTARKVNTTRTFVNETRPKSNFYKSHSPFKRPFNRTKTPRTKFSNQKVNTVGNKIVNAVGGNRETDVKASAGNKAHLADYQDFKGSSVSFGGSNGRITGKGKIKT